MPERVPWKESNLALIGSDLDHKIKQAAAEGEPQWEGLGESEGTWVWRIEQFRVVPWPKEQYGEFHQGDSYVVLHSYKKNPDTDALAHDIHIWIGKESSQDEYGTAAYKMVEADDFLRGAAIQHREVQGNESPVRVYQ
jgi:gelsolin